MPASIEQLARLSYLINANYLFFKDIATAAHDKRILEMKNAFIAALPPGVGNRILRCFIDVSLAICESLPIRQKGKVVGRGTLHARESIRVQKVLSALSSIDISVLEEFCQKDRSMIEKFYASKQPNLGEVQERLENLLRYEEEYRKALKSGDQKESQEYFLSITRSWDILTELRISSIREAKTQIGILRVQDSAAIELINKCTSAHRYFLASIIFPENLSSQLAVSKAFKESFFQAVIDDPELIRSLLNNQTISPENFLTLFTYATLEQQGTFLLQLCQHSEILACLNKKFKNNFNGLIEQFLLPFLKNTVLDINQKKLLCDTIISLLLLEYPEPTIHAGHRKQLTELYGQIQLTKLSGFNVPISALTEEEKKIFIQDGLVMMNKMQKILLLNHVNNGNSPITLVNYTELVVKLDEIFHSFRLQKLPRDLEGTVDWNKFLNTEPLYLSFIKFAKMLDVSKEMFNQAALVCFDPEHWPSDMMVKIANLFSTNLNQFHELIQEVQEATVNYLLLLLPVKKIGSADLSKEIEVRQKHKKSYCQIFVARKILGKLCRVSPVLFKKANDLPLQKFQRDELKKRLGQFKASSIGLVKDDIDQMDHVCFQMLIDCLADPKVFMDDNFIESLNLLLTTKQIRAISEQLVRLPFRRSFFKELFSGAQFKKIIDFISGNQLTAGRILMVQEFEVHALDYYTQQLVELNEFPANALKQKNVQEWVGIQKKFTDIINVISQLPYGDNFVLTDNMKDFTEQLVRVGVKLHRALYKEGSSTILQRASFVDTLSQISDKQLRQEMAITALKHARGNNSLWSKFKNACADRG